MDGCRLSGRLAASPTAFPKNYPHGPARAGFFLHCCGLAWADATNNAKTTIPMIENTFTLLRGLDDLSCLFHFSYIE